MAIILEITDLSYRDFKNINLSFEDKSFYSIIGPNNCGKTTLFELLTGIIPSNDAICCDFIDLNNDNIDEYIKKIGVVERVNNNSFFCKKVLDEMLFPLKNLGYSKNYSLNRIKEVLNLFEVSYLIDKYIVELNYEEQELLLIIISLLHKPKVLLLDSVLEIFSERVREKVIKVFKKLINEGLTVINFTNSLDESYYSNKIVLLDNYQVIGEYTLSDIYNNDKLFYEHKLEIPFLIDLSIKLKMYNLVSKEYLDLKEMVDDIWP